jgi:insulysin
MNITKDLILDKSENDTLEYNLLELSNKLNILIIKNADSELCGSTMLVNVGSVNEETPGMAHFLEHMLFMGSSKYPDENIFMSKVSQYGGETNAYTSDTNTVYYYTCASKFYLELLDIFMYFFIDPLLKKECIDREVNAVDSESKKNLQDDNWVINEISKKIYQDKHPINHYTCGDKTTLKGNLYKDVKSFFDKYYSSNLMSLVLYINNDISIKTLKKYINDNFNNIRNLELQINRSYGQIINIGKTLKYVPISDKNRLNIVFNVKPNGKYPLNPLYDNISLLEYLIENQEINSFYSILKEMGVIDRIILNNSMIFEDYQECAINIIFNHVDKFDDEFINMIINLFFNYIYNINRLIESNDDILKGLYDELKTKSLKSYIISEKINVIDTMLGYVNLLSSDLDKKHLINFATVIPEFATIKKEILEIFSNIRLENSSIIIGSHIYKKECINRDEFFDVCYNVNDFDITKIKLSPNDKIKLIETNEYISSDIKLIDEIQYDKPIMVESQKYIGFYYFDKKFKNPSTEILINIQLPRLLNLDDSVGFMMYNRCLIYYLEDFINKCLGANYLVTIKILYDVLYVMINGFTIKIEEIVDKLCELIDKYVIKHYQDVLKLIRQNLSDFKTSSPINKMNNLEKKIIYKTYFTPYEVLKKLDEFNEDKCKSSYKKVMSVGKTHIFVSGNINKEMSIRLMNKLNKCFYVKEQVELDDNVELRKIKEINKIEKININKEEKNNVSTYLTKLYTIKIGESSNWIEKIIFINLLYNIVQPHFFAILRTKEQIGYSVFAKKIIINQNKYSNVYFKLCVQSYLKDSDFLSNRIIDYINNDLYKYILKLNERDFDDFKKGLERLYKNKFNNLSEENIYLFMHIVNDKYMFDYKDIILKNIKHFSLDMFKEYFSKYITETKPYILLNISKNNNSDLDKKHLY